MTPDFQHSAGGLVVRDQQVLLISTRSGRRWQIPKGHLEPGETPQEAAVREIQEETGVSACPTAPLGMVEYDFRTANGRLIHKRVDYFLLSYRHGTEQDFDPKEVSGASWFPWHEAIAALTHDNERALVESAYYRRADSQGESFL